MDDQSEFLTPATSCEAAFRQIARACAKALDAAINQVMDDEDPEGPHRARVALRRLTTAMDAFSPILLCFGVQF